MQPLFPVPSCVLFAELASAAGRPVLPGTVLAESGTQPRRDATPEQAEKALAWHEAPWPAISEDEGGSPYREAFKNGATIFPRVLCVVEPVPAGRLGGNPAAPVVQSRRTRQEKPPWKQLSSLRGNVEAQFLRQLYLGKSVAPFRLLQPALAVIPWEARPGWLIDAEARYLAAVLNSETARGLVAQLQARG